MAVQWQYDRRLSSTSSTPRPRDGRVQVKRISVLASFVFLELHGFEVEASNDDVVETVIDLITRKIDFAELVTRLDAWMRPLR